MPEVSAHSEIRGSSDPLFDLISVTRSRIVSATDRISRRSTM